MQLLLVSFCLLCYFSSTCGTAFDDVTGDVTDWLESPANDLNNRDEMVFDAKSQPNNVCTQFCSKRHKTKKCKKLVKKYKKQWKSWASRTCKTCHRWECPINEPNSFFILGDDDVTTSDVTSLLKNVVNRDTDQSRITPQQDFDADSSKYSRKCNKYCKGKRRNKRCSNLVKGCNTSWKNCPASSICAMCHLSICPKYEPKSFFSLGDDDVTTGDVIAILKNVVNRDTDQSRITQQDFDADSSKYSRKCKKYCKGDHKNKKCSDLVTGCNTPWKNCPAMMTCMNCHFFRCPKESTPIFESDQQMFKMK